MLIGVLHLLPKDHPDFLDHAVRNAKRLDEAGVDALIVENYYDMPFKPYADLPTAIAVAVAVREVVRAVSVPVGVNLLRNGCRKAAVIAKYAGGRFIRCNAYTDVVLSESGLLMPQAPYLKGVKVLADVHVKHGLSLYPPTLAEAVETASTRASPDAIIITGSKTGEPPDPVDLATARAYTDLPVLIGSGICFSTLGILKIADGAIVGTCLKEGKEIDVDKARRLVREARSLLSPRRRLSLG
ncbi:MULTISPECIES: BtpA/SgcQ family protein [Pyrobaculum]|uniref:Photosystem I assembly BtpA n=2 Tax=Pyrobaculum arsenaticum TaxID=121277 RepID=A4WLA8_PYRAR|nr:BtpA/SgcQ family protein [Pyrobaculum arsenaticum]ABP51175.1 photosystem I assembly BtpA [Pyrobaculum arsenaticum DSM 13514]MCY0891589.1 BtpA/SgcQ family protein [Pyrobaculum arsenaticum]NYR15101.1 BtpA/SgcQ family protein [Pyrobaculum arsenaticum]